MRADARLPEALDAAASIRASLHADLEGCLEGLGRTLGHGGRYLRDMILGNHGIELADLCALAILEPEATARALALVPFSAPPLDGKGLSCAAGELLVRYLAENAS